MTTLKDAPQSREGARTQPPPMGRGGEGPYARGHVDRETVRGTKSTSGAEESRRQGRSSVGGGCVRGCPSARAGLSWGRLNVDGDLRSGQWALLRVVHRSSPVAMSSLLFEDR